MYERGSERYKSDCIRQKGLDGNQDLGPSPIQLLSTDAAVPLGMVSILWYWSNHGDRLNAMECSSPLALVSQIGWGLQTYNEL